MRAKDFGPMIERKIKYPILPPFNLKEYVLAKPIVFDFPTEKYPLDQWEEIGRIATGYGQLKVYRLIIDYSVYYGAGKNELVSFIGFVHMNDNLLMAKNAYTIPDAQQKGISSELMLFAMKASKVAVISDTEMTLDGIALWKGLLKSGKFTSLIYDLKTGNGFPFDQIGKKLDDGTVILSPEQDNKSSLSITFDPINGQRFFWLLQYTNVSEGYDVERHTHPLIQPYIIFGNGYP